MNRLKEYFEIIKQYAKYYERLILYCAAGVLTLILIILISVNHFSAGRINTNAIKADQYEEVNALVDKYYTAIAEGDLSTLQEIVVPFSETDGSAVTHKSELISQYDNIICYTHKDGVAKDYYIVFAYYEIYFPDVDTPVPGLETLFICKDAEDKLYINNDTANLSDAQEKKLAEVLEKIEVIALFDDVETSFSIALHSDEGVAKFFEALGGDTSKYEEPTAEPATAENTEGDDAAASTDTATTEGLTLGSTDAPKQVGAVNKKMAAIINLDMFQSEDSSSTVIAMINVGTLVEVKEHLASGYSKVVYNSVEGYVESNYIYDYIEVNDKVKGTCSYYASCSNVIEPLGELSEGIEYERTRYFGNGYSEIKINETYVYVKTAELGE